MIPKRKIPTKKVTVHNSFGANLCSKNDNLRCTKIVPPHASRQPEERGNPRIVQTLVDASADGNIRSPSIHRGGNTAMDLAREGGYKEVEKKLGNFALPQKKRGKIRACVCCRAPPAKIPRMK